MPLKNSLPPSGHIVAGCKVEDRVAALLHRADGRYALPWRTIVVHRWGSAFTVTPDPSSLTQ
jgi:hypothetical protein